MQGLVLSLVYCEHFAVASPSPDSTGVPVLASGLGERDSSEEFLQQVWSCYWSELAGVQTADDAKVHHQLQG